MPIDQLANYAEVFGGAAVIISLLYVAFQVRANNRERRQHRRIETMEVLNTVHDFMSGPGNLSEIFAKASTDYNNLTLAERVRFSNMYSKCFVAWDLLIGMREDGDLTQAELDRFEAYMLASFDSPMIRHWWKNSAIHESYPDRVVLRVSAHVKEADEKGMTPAPGVPYAD